MGKAGTEPGAYNSPLDVLPKSKSDIIFGTTLNQEKAYIQTSRKLASTFGEIPTGDKAYTFGPSPHRYKDVADALRMANYLATEGTGVTSGRSALIKEHWTTVQNYFGSEQVYGSVKYGKYGKEFGPSIKQMEFGKTTGFGKGDAPGFKELNLKTPTGSYTSGSVSPRGISRSLLPVSIVKASSSIGSKSPAYRSIASKIASYRMPSSPSIGSKSSYSLLKSPSLTGSSVGSLVSKPPSISPPSFSPPSISKPPYSPPNYKPPSISPPSFSPPSYTPPYSPPSKTPPYVPPYKLYSASGGSSKLGMGVGASGRGSGSKHGGLGIWTGTTKTNKVIGFKEFFGGIFKKKAPVTTRKKKWGIL
jgi:hypothetical protein